MWGNKREGTIYIYEGKGGEYICNISGTRVVNYMELPYSFNIKKVYFKATKDGSSWGQLSFVMRLNFTGTHGISGIYIEI